MNMTSINGRIDNTGAKVPEGESSLEHAFPGAKVSGSKSSREQIGQGPIETFAPGSELARERKGCDSYADTPSTVPEATW